MNFIKILYFLLIINTDNNKFSHIKIMKKQIINKNCTIIGSISKITIAKIKNLLHILYLKYYLLHSIQVFTYLIN